MHRELLKQRLLVAVEEVVAPVDQCLQRDMGGIGGRALMQERRALLEKRGDLGEREHVHSCSRQLQRQRQTLDAPGDLGREGDRVGVRIKARSRGPRPLDEELHCGRSEWRDRHAHFACHVK